MKKNYKAKEVKRSTPMKILNIISEHKRVGASRHGKALTKAPSGMKRVMASVLLDGAVVTRHINVPR